MSQSIIDFLNSSLGIISIRLLCISFIGSGANLIIQRTFDRLELYENSKNKVKLQIKADLISYAVNIGLSIMVSNLYNKNALLIDNIIEGVLYGLGALTAQYIFTSGMFLNLIKIWRKK